MKVMILGAGGEIGEATKHCLVADGHDVICVSRSCCPRVEGAVQWISADRADAQRIGELVRKFNVDTVIDFVGYEEAETQALIRELDGVLARYVLMSSADVYRNFELLHCLETGTPDVGLLTEDAPLRTVNYPYRQANSRAPDDPQKWMDNYEKLLVEATVQEMAGDWVICRLPMVYGLEKATNRFPWGTAPMLSGAPEIVLPGAWLDWVTTYGFVGNVAAAIALASHHPAAGRQVFNVTDCAPAAHSVWLERLARITGWAGRIVRTDDPEHPVAIATRGLDLSVPLAVSGDRLRDVLGFMPPVQIEDTLRAVLEVN